MTEINLLPPAQRGISAKKLFLAMAMLVAVLFCLGSSFVYWRLLQAEQSFQADQTAYTLLQPTVNQQSLINADKEKYAEKIKVLANISQQKVSGYAVLVYLGCLVTEDVWLSEVISSENGMWTLKGNMTSYQHLVKFIEGFSQDAIFSEPEIKHVSADGAEPSFELRIKLRE